MKRYLFIIGIVACLASPLHARTWTHKKTGKTVIGDFDKFDGNDVKIKVTVGRNKGKIISLSRFDLSKADRDWLETKAEEIHQGKKVPKHTAAGVEDLEEDGPPGGAKDALKAKGSNMVMNIGWCVLVLAELMFVMAGMSSGVLRGIIAAIPAIGWVLFALMEWQNAKTPFIIALVGGGIVAGGYFMGGGV